MFPIDRKAIKAMTRDINAKTTDAKTNPTLFDQFKLKIWNMIEHLEVRDVYTLGQWIIAHDRVLKNQTGKENGKQYRRGDLVMVELGASNFKYEPSFEHPAVVLKNTWREILIAPSSSKKYGTGYPEIIDATPADGGFTLNSGIQMHAVRWVHKNRVTVEMGAITNPALLDRLDDYMIQWLPKYTALLAQKDADLAAKDQLIAEKESDIAALEARVTQLQTLHERAKENAFLSGTALRVILERNPELKKEFKIAAEHVQNLDENAG